VRAWIETIAVKLTFILMSVARHVRAWIETKIKKNDEMINMSHAMCVRGLKQKLLVYV